MQLSIHFSLREFTRSAKAAELGIDNTPPAYTLIGEGTIRQLCLKVLEPIRARWGPLNITSGYRCPSLNTAILGSPSSDHVADEFGAAADVVPDDPDVRMEDIFDWIHAESDLPYDQCILEHSGAEDRPKCIHVSWRHNPRRMAGIAKTQSRGKVEKWLYPVSAEDA
jgi:hypothetical protein